MKASDARKAIQDILGVVADEIFGPKTLAAYQALAAAPAASEWPVPSGVHSVHASSFADSDDVEAFRACKAQGKTDSECFLVGDNGVGYWGDDTTGPTPMCALPPEDWEQFGSGARGKPVSVVCGDKAVICELRDSMPKKANIKNGAGIDLNEAAWKALGYSPPQMRPVTWRWATWRWA